MKRLALAFGVLLMGVGHAQASSLDALCEGITTARTEVLLYAPQVVHVPFAECLRRAVVDYRRSVSLLTVPYFNQDSRSVVNSLALAGVKVYEANVNSKDALLVLDGLTYSAPGLGMQDQISITLLDASTTPAYLAWFRKAFSSAQRLTFLDVGKRLQQR